ncbi:MAG: hypothetical protein Q8K45_21260 [Rubrivivax sp.]|nr:hypothetical protein [Rubrivivax sp.]
MSCAITALLLIRLHKCRGEWVSVDELMAHTQLSHDVVVAHLQDLPSPVGLSFERGTLKMVAAMIPLAQEA